MPGLRKGRDRCTATRRDGGKCQAPAIAGGLVCRRHGGGAPQVRIAAQRTLLLEDFYRKYQAWQRVRGTPFEFDALCVVSRAQLALESFERTAREAASIRAQLAAAERAWAAAGRGQAMTVGRP